MRISSRREARAGADATPEWATLDLATATPESLRPALSGIDAVVHAASDHRNSAATDVEGTRRLVDAAREAGVAHFVYVSIVGVALASTARMRSPILRPAESAGERGSDSRVCMSVASSAIIAWQLAQPAA